MLFIKLNNNNLELLFLLLWLAVASWLWYIGVAMWVSLILGAIISWLLRGILQQLGAAISAYDISIDHQAIDYWPIKFTRGWRRRLLSILLPLRQEILKAEVRYVFERGDFWPNETVWRETNSPILAVASSGIYHIAVLQIDKDNGQLRTFYGETLPSRFTVDIRLKYLNGKTRKHFVVELEID